MVSGINNRRIRIVKTMMLSPMLSHNRSYKKARLLIIGWLMTVSQIVVNIFIFVLLAC